MDERQWLTDRFEQHRPRLQAVAYRMLGSVADADDALQEAWLRIRDEDPQTVANMQAWLTTIVGRVCLNMLRARRTRREDLTVHVPEPLVSWVVNPPEADALIDDSVGVALLVVLDTLSPSERLAFVLHDVFGVSFAEVAAVLDRSEAAAQKLASRARRRVRDSPRPDADLHCQRRVVDAFFAASRDGDFEALLTVLHPDVQLRIDGGVLRAGASCTLKGAQNVAKHTAIYAPLHPFIRPAVVNGAAGAVVIPHGHVFSVMAFTVAHGQIRSIDALVDPERLARVDLTALV